MTTRGACKLHKVLLNLKKIMNKKSIPFDRYNWDLKYLFEEYEIQKELDPVNFGTSKEEVDGYIYAIMDAQSRYSVFHRKWKQRIVCGPLIVFIILSIILGVIIGWFHVIMPYSTYFICLMVGSYLFAIWWWFADKYKLADKFLDHYYRKIFYPSVLPNVERFLSYCLAEKFSRGNPMSEIEELLSYRKM